MTSKLLIGIAGPKRSGKDTLARLLCNTLPARQDSFAGPLRSFIGELIGLNPELLDLHKETPVPWLDGVTPRQMMQTVGTEWGRVMVHPELWVHSLMNRISPTQHTVISDVRFPNEARAILAHGGIVIAIDRPGTGEGDTHISESPLPADLVTFRVRNIGTPDDMLSSALDGLSGRENTRVRFRDDRTKDALRGERRIADGIFGGAA